MKKLFLAIAAVLLVSFAGHAQQQQQQPAASGLAKVRITGWALSMGTTATGANQTIQIDINNWVPLTTRDQLITTFMEKKQDGLLRALQKMPEIGRWRFPGYMGPDPDNIYRLGTPIRYANYQPGEDGGYRIVIMTDRIITFKEQVNQPRSIDYPFTLMEMRFGKDLTGEGRMQWYTQINFDKKKELIELENWSSEPVRLNNLKLEMRK